MDQLLYASLCLIWGSTWLVIKVGLNGVPPFLAAGLRFLLAAAILAPVALWRPKRALSRDDKISIISCGLLQFALGYACVYWAEQYISSGLTAILFSTMPLFVAVLSAFWTKTETLSGRKLAGILIGIGGTAVLFWPSQNLAVGKLGMACALIGSLAASTNLVVMKRHGKHADIYQLNALAMGLGAACLLTLSVLTESYAGLRWSGSNVLALVYLAVFGTVVTFLSYWRLIKTMEATRLSMVSLIVPVVAVALGWMIMGEKITAATAIGIATILAGVATAVVSTRPA